VQSEVLLRRIFTTLSAVLLVAATGLPALAAGEFTISAPSSITYNASADGFAVSGISVTSAPDYIQVGLSLTDNTGTQVDSGDAFHIAVANQCSLDISYTNPSTGGTVSFSGDNTVNLVAAGATEDVMAAISQLWVYRTDSTFCNRGNRKGIGQRLLLRRIQVTAVESAPGLWWSPSTQHYYQLATQTADDGMGQPTNNRGQVTDPSRYFVRWSTARTAAKNSTITIGGQSHTGYLAAITTKDEFSFLNNNVTGGQGKLYPAWVGGSDAAVEGVWNWVDGPEAQVFGGDTLTHDVTVHLDPQGRQLVDDGESLYLNFGAHQSYTDFGLIFRDSTGNPVIDTETGYVKAVNFDTGNYCANFRADMYQALADYQDPAIGPEIDITPYGSEVHCNVSDAWWGSYHSIWLNPVLVTDSQQEFATDYDNIYLLTSGGQRATDTDTNYLVVRPGTSDFTDSTQSVPNYNGANFWGLDSGWGPAGGTDTNYCTSRGVRGYCNMGQNDTSGGWQYNSFYVYWSNGQKSYVADWDGTGNKPGDGAYNPQPDNASLNGTVGENALVINWCTRNPSDYSQSAAKIETLYGNTGYHCTPGWNDLAEGNWGGASNSYPNGFRFDTPNQIGTTDYVIEYCGYASEATCQAAAPQIALIQFSTNVSGCPQAGSPSLSVSYSAPTVDKTPLSTPTMVTETFDSLPVGWMTDQVTNVGFMSGTTALSRASSVGGAGGTGIYPSAVDTYLALPTTECYLGFWWSAGNSNNHVDLLDDGNNVLASFDATDLVNALGGCPNPFCGNPNDGYQNAGELYAYVHMRFPTGFQKVHFYGSGFEFDNVSTSVTVPNRSSSETSLTGSAALAIDAPQVVLVDPRAHAVGLPGVLISGDTAVSLCIRQVADIDGTAIDGAQTVAFSDGQSESASLSTIASDLVISGSTSDVVQASNHLVASAVAAGRLSANGANYYRVAVASGSSPDSTTCNSTIEAIVEIRPVSLDFVQMIQAFLGMH
jgi:hypothetical protein